jgi:hypothetical protein
MTQTTPNVNPAAAALRAEGSTITLADGTEKRIRYGMLGLYHIECEFGSIGALMDRAGELEDKKERGPMLATCLDLLRTGWTDENGDNPDTAPSREWVARQLDVTQLTPYLEAALEAFSEAFGPEPPAGALREEGQVPAAADPTLPSLGSSSGTSPQVPASLGGSGA